MDNIKPLNKPLWKKMQRCWENDMYVYQKPVNTGMKSKVKIYLSIQEQKNGAKKSTHRIQ